jgi:galactosamine-6-phosphate isomerase
MSRQATDDVVEIMGSRKNPVICTASGDSPAGLYKEIVQRKGKDEMSIEDWFFVGLDEWIGLNENDEGSCRYHLNQQLFEPLRVVNEKICFFDGRAGDLENECDKTENFIHEHGGIDVAILGLGMNGHIGMNEPGTSARLRSHVVDLDPITQQVGQKYFKKEQKLTKGITLGITTLMEARNIFLLVSGKHKAAITQKIVEGEISEKLPGTLLRRHPALSIYLDKEAASGIVG